MPEYLPGKLTLDAFAWRDAYAAVERWHYVGGRPATWAAVVAVRHQRPAGGEVVAAAGVLSWPSTVCAGRNLAFDLAGKSYGERIRFANETLRTISRVVVRPAYRGCGLARSIVLALVARCPTPYVESIAAMGAFHPMFARCGMARVDPPGRPPYFWRSTAAALSTTTPSAIALASRTSCPSHSPKRSTSTTSTRSSSSGTRAAATVL